jgi:hypothetical protein
MPIQVIPREPSFGERLAEKLEGAANNISAGYFSGQERRRLREELQGENMAAEELGVKLKGLNNPKLRETAFSEQLKQNTQGSAISKLEEDRGLPPGSLKGYGTFSNAEKVSRPEKEKSEPLTSKPVPKEISNKIRKIESDLGPDASADDLRLAMDEEGVPPVYSGPYVENRRRTQESSAKTGEALKTAMRAETFPLRKQFADKAQAAYQGIANKEQLINLIDKGDINDPTFAAVAQAIPFDLGKRLLSPDTVTYKAGLVDEFKDLRNIFQGQTRIKEIELLEEKVADLYLTDEQKKAVLKSRIGALKADIIRAEVAASLENRTDLGIIQFNNEVEERAKPKLEALFNQILDEQKAVIKNAENRKNIPLDPDDPEDLKILEQILEEARGDPAEATAIAKKKGYKVE